MVDWVYVPLTFAGLWACCWVVVKLIEIADRIAPLRRPKPDGYVGLFRRSDGRVVHVARVRGRLMVVSDEPPAVRPSDLGGTTGRELFGWEKLASSPGAHVPTNR